MNVEFFLYFCAFFLIKMKKDKFLILCFLVALLGFTSCSKDFDSNAPYKDVTIVYGLLNPDDQDHYIKIYKGFLTSDNAYEAAKEYDSLYYFDQIDVVMEEYKDGHLTATYPLDMTTDIPRELEGDFAAPEQLLYHFSAELNPEATYKLVITNKESGRVVTAETDVLGSFYLRAPSDNTLQVGIHSTQNTDVKFATPKNAKSFEVFQTFYYIERDRITHEEVKKSIRRKLSSGVIRDGISDQSCSYVPANLLTVLSGRLEENPNIDRYITTDSALCYEVWVVNEPIYNYVANNSISGSVVLDRLSYTNVWCSDDDRVAAVLGTRRSVCGWHGITAASQNELVTGELTRKLNFHYDWEYLELHGND